MKAFDLTKVPDEDLTREYMRRLNERRRRVGGGAKVMRPCTLCGKEFSAREMRVHAPQCKQDVIDNTLKFLPSLRAVKAAAKKAGLA